MIIQNKQLLWVYLLLSIGFYAGFIRFLGTLMGFGGAQGDFEGAAAGNLVNQLVALSLLLMSLFFLLKSARLNIRQFLSQGWIWIALIGFFSLSLMWSATPFVSFRRIVGFSTLVLVCFVLANTFTAKSLFNVISNAIVAAVIFGFMYQVLSGQQIAFGLGDRDAGLRGIFQDKNAAARVYAYGLILFVGLQKYRTKTDIVGLSILVFALTVSQSASAIILATMGCGLVILFRIFRSNNKHYNFRRLMLVFILLAVATVIVSILYEYLLSLLGRDANLTDRTIIWELILPYIEDKPIFGYGFGSFWASGYVADFIERWGFIGNAHSGYLEAMLNGGVIGFALLVTLLVVFIKYALKNYVNGENKYDCAELVLAMCAAQAVINYIGFIVLNHNSFDMFIFSVAFFVAASALKKNTLRHDTYRP
jgi:O-antigen ligase